MYYSLECFLVVVRKKGTAISICIVFLLFLGWILSQSYEYENVKPFSGHLQEYISIDTLKINFVKHLKGKCLVTDKDHRKVHSVFSQLPNQIKAQTPNEVDVLIFSECKKNEIGHYTDGYKGYIYSCKITAVDKARSEIASMVTIDGPAPPRTKTGPGEVIGDYPTDAIRAYIKKLFSEPW